MQNQKDAKKVSNLAAQFEAAAQQQGAQAAQDKARAPASSSLPRTPAALPANHRTSDVGLNNNGLSQRTEALVALASKSSGALGGLSQDKEATAAKERQMALDEEFARRFQTQAALTQYTSAPSASSPSSLSSSSAVPVAPIAPSAPVASHTSSAMGGSRPNASVSRPPVIDNEVKEREEKHGAEQAAILPQFTLQQAARPGATSSVSSSVSSTPRQAHAQAQQDQALAFTTLMSLVEARKLTLTQLLDPSYESRLDAEIQAIIRPLRQLPVQDILGMYQRVKAEEAIFAQASKACTARVSAPGRPPQS